MSCDWSDSGSPQTSSGSTSLEVSPAASPGLPGGHRRFVMRINLSSCKYPVLRVVQRQLGWIETDDEDAPVHWCDTSAGTERLVRLSRPQKLNHFPGMLEIARKKALARNLAAMRALFPEEYDFAPKTFLLPEHSEAFEADLAAGAAVAAEGGKRPTFILKLDNGSMGRGIKLVQTATQAANALPTFDHENVVASQYIDRPLLIDGKKFDLRIYCLVRCCNPLRIFLCREGLVRFCTEPYKQPGPGNLNNAYAHLTNYAVNKLNPAFVFNQDAESAGTGSKWTITAFAEWMAAQGHDFEKLWRQVAHIVVKTVIAAQPMLQYQYDCATKADDDGLTCFELLGYDVLIDEDMRPWLLEVNHSPSLTTDTPLDLEIKSRLVREVLALAGVQPDKIRAELQARDRNTLARLYNSHRHGGPAGLAGSPGVAGLLIKPVWPPAGASAPTSPGAPGIACTGMPLPIDAPASRPGPTIPGTDSCRGGAVSPSLGSCPAGAFSPGAAGCALASACTSPGPGGCALLGPAAGEAVRGTPEWEEAQRVYEDAHLGQFDRIMPPADDPEQVELYERLLGGALQVFYRSTMQGRNQHRLVQIKERRQQEEAEAVARQEALQRRAEGLRAWMATVCQKHREEQALRAAAAAAEAASGAAPPVTDLPQLVGSVSGQDGRGSGSNSSTWDSGSGSGGGGTGQAGWGAADSTGAGEAAAVLRSHFAAARLAMPSSHGLPASSAPQQQQQHKPARGLVRGAGCGAGKGKAAPPGCSLKAMPLSSAAAFLCVSGAPVGGGGQCSESARAGITSAAEPLRRPLSAGARCTRAEPVTIEAVIEQRLAAAAAASSLTDAAVPAAGGEAGLAPRRPGSAALAAWAAAASLQPSQAVEATPPPCVPLAWQVLAWESYTGGHGGPGGPPAVVPRPASSSTFLDRVATFTQEQERQGVQLQAELASLQLRSTSDGSGGSWGASASGSDPDFADRSADGSVLLGGSGSGGHRSGCGDAKGRRVATPVPEVSGSALEATYIPPTLLSALHTVRMSPRLLSGLRSGRCAAAAAQQQEGEQEQQAGRKPWRGSGASKKALQAGQTQAGGSSTAGSSRSTASPAYQPGTLGQAAFESPWTQQPGAAHSAPGKPFPSCAPLSPSVKGPGQGTAVGSPLSRSGPPKPAPQPCSPSLLRWGSRPGAGSPKTSGPASPAMTRSPSLAASRGTGDGGGLGVASQQGRRASLAHSSSGSVPSSSAGSQYRASIEQQAVQSVAALINNMIKTRGL